LNKFYLKVCLHALAGLVLLAASACWADTLVLVTSQGALGANDSINWSQLGPSGTTLGSSFSGIHSANGALVSGSFTGSGSCVLSVGPTPPGGCGWVPSPGFFNSGEAGIQTFDGNNGTGPLTLTFGGSFTGFGIAIQDDDVFPYTAFLTALNGNVPVGSVFESSNGSGDAIFIGFSDLTGTITGVQIGLSACPGCQDSKDFGVATGYLVAQTPEPSSLAMLGTGILALGGFIRRRIVR